MKCYKVVRPHRDKLYSALVTVPKYRREYSINNLVDMGFVFRNLIDAKIWGGGLHIYEAEASVILPWMIPYGEMALPSNKRSMDLFWEGLNKYNSNSSPPGTCIAFDIRLVRRVA